MKRLVILLLAVVLLLGAVCVFSGCQEEKPAKKEPVSAYKSEGSFAELGADRLEQAKENCKKLLTLVVSIGLVCVVVCCAFGMVLPDLFSVTQELKTMAMRITLIMGVFAPFNFVYSFCFFCLRAGGDTRNAMLLDSGYMWMAPVPAAVLMAVFLPGRIPIYLAVLVVQFLMNAKVVWALMVLKKGKWLRNITKQA